MTLRFDETLRGTWQELRPAGRSGRFDFTCRAEAEGLARFAADRLARLSGTATLEGIGTGPLEGTLRCDPIAGREISYDFAFRVGATRFHFVGRKTPRLQAPWASMTTLSGTLERDGVTWSEASLRFRVRDLPALLASVRLAP